MAIYTTFPHDQNHYHIQCIICTQSIPLDQAVPGSLRANGQQAFACEQHIQARETWITAWALFDIEQDAMINTTTGVKQPA